MKPLVNGNKYKITYKVNGVLGEYYAWWYNKWVDEDKDPLPPHIIVVAYEPCK